MDFRGLRPVELDVPCVAFELLDGTLVDLSNEADLAAIRLDEIGLTFEFAHHTLGTVLLRCWEVRNLDVKQHADWIPQEFTDVDHLLIRPPGTSPRVDFKAGGLAYEFDCTVIALEVHGAGAGDRGALTVESMYGLVIVVDPDSEDADIPETGNGCA